MSTLKADTIQNTSGGAATLTKQSAAKAWFEMGSDFILDASLNIASVTDDGTGLITYTYTNSMDSANYAPNAGPTGGARNTVFIWVEPTSLTSSSAAASMGTQNGGSTALADSENCMALHGDLA